jgi:hypothetical protein
MQTIDQKIEDLKEEIVFELNSLDDDYLDYASVDVIAKRKEKISRLREKLAELNP